MNKAIMGLLLLTAIIATVATILPMPSAMATDPGTQGQPNQSCQDFFPGLLLPPGFNTGGFGQAGSVYAGSGQNTQTPANSNAVSQYDVACFQQATPPP